jgi:hypothetical protein
MIILPAMAILAAQRPSAGIGVTFGDGDRRPSMPVGRRHSGRPTRASTGM